MNISDLVYRRLLQRYFWPPLREVCVAAITFDPAAPHIINGWDMAGFADGTHFKGTGLLEYLRQRQFAVLILQHWAPPRMMDVLRHELPNTKILFWTGIEVIRANPIYSKLHQEPFRLELEPDILIGTDGKPIDIYFNNPIKGPAYAVNMLAPGLAQKIGSFLFHVRNDCKHDGWFIDSMTRYSYLRPVPNAPADEQNRTAVWPDIVREIRRWDARVAVWGNIVGPWKDCPWGIDVGWAEQFFHHGGPRADTAAKLLHDNLCLNTQRSSWDKMPEQWEYLALEAALRGIKNLYVCSAWTGQQNFVPTWRRK